MKSHLGHQFPLTAIKMTHAWVTIEAFDLNPLALQVFAQMLHPQ